MYYNPRAWLFPVLAPVCSLAVRVYYRFKVEGRAPEAGPVLFVANHPNSLVDAMVVTAAAGRPVHFLAKATLFDEPLIGPLVRAGGAIPVYRRQDDPLLVDRNPDMFAEVHKVLAAGHAVGIFPEGLSHSEPSLARLRTGAARISIGAAEWMGVRFPIIPIGLVHRNKERFRSETLALIGPPVKWADLAGHTEEDADAVRDLTSRIERALRDVTVNVENLEERPVIECAEMIYSSEMGLDDSPEHRIPRVRQVSESFSRLRREDPDRVEGLYDDVEQFAWTLGVLGIQARHLDRSVRLRSTVGWTLKVFGLLIIGGPISAAGHVMFYVPYRLTDWHATRPQIRVERQSSWKLLGGFVIYSAWMFLLVLVAWWLIGFRAALAAAVSLPLLAIATQFVRERWRGAWRQAQRYWLLQRTGDARERLLRRRAKLAGRLERLRQEVLGGAAPRT